MSMPPKEGHGCADTYSKRLIEIGNEIVFLLETTASRFKFGDEVLNAVARFEHFGHWQYNWYEWADDPDALEEMLDEIRLLLRLDSVSLPYDVARIYCGFGANKLRAGDEMVSQISKVLHSNAGVKNVKKLRAAISAWDRVRCEGGTIDDEAGMTTGMLFDRRLDMIRLLIRTAVSEGKITVSNW